ncbi:MAG TPA: class I SAM-dependent methyltransferase [Ramlibacter sp.]|nr:class I SAM-dependent methyltransferase [Ramlibacter sp.]
MMLAAPAASHREREGLYRDVAAYYGSRLGAHGPTPLGVDWTCEPTQQLRFVQLLKACDFTQPFSLNDLGCGYGALRGFLGVRWPKAQVDYLGIDLVPEMIAAASRKWDGIEGAAFAVGSNCPRVADYSVASGVFNVKLDQPAEAWEAFIRAMLDDLAANSRLGFAVNFLRAVDTEPRVPQLYRALPQTWIDYCEKELGARVEVLSSYGMREFTLLARK